MRSFKIMWLSLMLELWLKFSWMILWSELENFSIKIFKLVFTSFLHNFFCWEWLSRIFFKKNFMRKSTIVHLMSRHNEWVSYLSDFLNCLFFYFSVEYFNGKSFLGKLNFFMFVRWNFHCFWTFWRHKFW